SELDTYSAYSHQRADEARSAGLFEREIVPIQTAEGEIFDTDESIRPSTTVEGLADLNPAFKSPDLDSRFPEIGDWKITPGNSSQITDGASAMLLMSESTANRLGLKPRARFVSFDVYGANPLFMLTAPIP